MEVSYYPGCSLHGMAREYDESIRAVCRRLGISLLELPDWNCCGASSAHFMDDDLAFDLASRNLMLAEKSGRELLVPCAACFQRLKSAEKELLNHPERSPEKMYEHKAPIHHISDFFARPEILKNIASQVKKRLAALRGVAYYGCLSQRPPRITDSPAPENPLAMDRVLQTLGFRVLPWSYKTECCGGSLALTRPDIVLKLSGDLFDAAQEAGAECLVVDCQMCQSNLDTRQAEIEAGLGRRFNLPVIYLTELMAVAFGDGQGRDWWKKHFQDPEPWLRSKNLLTSDGVRG